jgi:hypothetical protein
VYPNTLLAGEHPGGNDAAETRLRLERLQNAGIDSFIDLTEVGEIEAYQPLLRNGVEYRRSPIVDASVPLNVSQTQEVLRSLRSSLGRGKRIYVHCRAGIGRTGLIIGCYLVESEGSGRAGLKTLNRLWRQSERSNSWPTVPQTSEQADYVRHWLKLSKSPSGRFP